MDSNGLDSNQPVRLAPDQLASATTTLVEAFRHDPLYAYICPDENCREHSMRALWDALIQVTLVKGEVWTTPHVEGVALWLSPGNTDPNLWFLLRTGLRLPRAALRFSGPDRRRLMDIDRYTNNLHRRAMTGRHWYLWGLGVAPAFQRKGCGSQLLQPVLARADQARLPCYLETESEGDVAFYRHLGFEVLTDERVPGHDLELWTMARAPKR